MQYFYHRAVLRYFPERTALRPLGEFLGDSGALAENQESCGVLKRLHKSSEIFRLCVMADIASQTASQFNDSVVIIMHYRRLDRFVDMTDRNDGRKALSRIRNE